MATLRSNKDSAVRRRSELAKTLLSTEEQQKLVIERTQRLLNAGNAPPKPANEDLLKNRAHIRQDVGHIVDDEILFEIGSSFRHRDMAAANEKQYQHFMNETNLNETAMEKTKTGIDMRVEYRDYLNEEAANEEFANEFEETAQLNAKADEAIDGHIRAEWMLNPPGIIQRKDLDRERRMFDESRELISKLPEMKDFDKYKIDLGSNHPSIVNWSGDLGNPNRTDAEREAQLESIRIRDENNQKLAIGREKAVQAAKGASEAEELVRTLAEALEKRGRSMGFDERVRERKKMLKAKELSEQLLLESEEAKNNYELMRIEIGGASQSLSEVNHTNDKAIFDNAPRSLVVWLLGVTDGVNIGKCHFGCYSQEDDPPCDFWLPFSNDEKETKLQVRIGGGTFSGVTVNVEGCKNQACVGKYSPDGMSDDVQKFTNNEGVSVFRARLRETPELGITDHFLSREAPGRHKDSDEISLAQLHARNCGNGLDVYNLAGDQLDPNEFQPLRGVGLRMIVTSLREQVARRLKHRADIEKLVENEFNAEMARAASERKAMGKSVKNNASSSSIATATTTTSAPMKIDYTALLMKAPNTTLMRSDDEVVSRVSGASKVVYSNAGSVPPLCKNWSMLKCKYPASHCKHRHYFISDAERLYSVDVRQEKERVLDMDVLLAISTREALLESLSSAAAEAESNFLRDDNSNGIERRHVSNLLALLDRLRLCSVKCCESISRWRDHKDSLRNLMSNKNHSEGNGSVKGWWAVTVQVTGAELYKASAAFRSKVKRLQRDRIEAKKAIEFHYLGVYPTKAEAGKVYDQHIAKEAARKGTNPNRLPQKRYVARKCGFHFAVEPEGAPKHRPCEQCAVDQAGSSGGNGTRPPFLWEGANYLLKMQNDCNFLGEVGALSEYLGNEFAFIKNPLFLAPDVLSGETRIGPTTEFRQAQATKAENDEIVAKKLTRKLNRMNSKASRSTGALSEPLSPLSPHTPITPDGRERVPPLVKDTPQEPVRRKSTTVRFNDEHPHNESIDTHEKTAPPHFLSRKNSQHSATFDNGETNHHHPHHHHHHHHHHHQHHHGHHHEKDPHAVALAASQGDEAALQSLGLGSRFGAPGAAITLIPNKDGQGGFVQHLPKHHKHAVAPAALGGNFLSSDIFTAETIEDGLTSLTDDQHQPSQMISGYEEPGLEMLDMMRIKKSLKLLEQEEEFAAWQSQTSSSGGGRALDEGAVGIKKRKVLTSSSAAPTAVIASPSKGGPGGGVQGSMISGVTTTGSPPRSPKSGSGGEYEVDIDDESDTPDDPSDEEDDVVTGEDLFAAYSAEEEAAEEERLLRMIAGKTDGEAFVTKLTYYEEAGAVLAMPQTRPKDPNKMGNIFCRRDKGKWKGLGIPGPEMRRFEFAANLVAEGKRRQKVRDKVGAQIRKEYSRSLGKVRKNRLGKLLAKARILKGSRLTLDLHTGEKFLTRHLLMVKASHIIQRCLRGLFGRQAAKARTKLLNEAHLKRRSFEQIIGELSKNVVNDAIKIGKKRAARCLIHPILSLGVTLDNRRLILHFKSLEHYDYVRYSIPSTNHHEEDDDDTTKSKSIHNLPTSSRLPMSLYNVGTRTYETRAAIDLAERIAIKERIKVEAYDPITCEKVELIFTEEEMRTRLALQELNQDFMNLQPRFRISSIENIKNHLLLEKKKKDEQILNDSKNKSSSSSSSSFFSSDNFINNLNLDQRNISHKRGSFNGYERILREEEKDITHHNNDITIDLSSYSTTQKLNNKENLEKLEEKRKQIEKEEKLNVMIEKEEIFRKIGNGSCYPTRMVSRAILLKGTCVDRGLGYGEGEFLSSKETDFERRQRGFGINPETKLIKRQCWEPAREARVLTMEAKGAMNLAQFMRNSAIETLRMQSLARKSLSEAHAGYETAEMYYEDMLGKYLKSSLECDAAVIGSKLAMAFSAKTLYDFDHPDVEDWSQSYEPFEDGNNWKQLRRKRAATFAKLKAEKAVKLAEGNIVGAKRSWIEAIKNLKFWDKRADIQIRRREQAGMWAEEMTQLGSAANNMLKEALQRTASLLTIRSRSTVSTSTALIWREHAWTVNPFEPTKLSPHHDDEAEDEYDDEDDDIGIRDMNKKKQASDSTSSLMQLVQNDKMRNLSSASASNNNEKLIPTNESAYRCQKHIKRSWNQLYRGAIVIKSSPNSTSSNSSSFAVKLSKRCFVTIKQDSSRNEKQGTNKNKFGRHGGIGHCSRSQGRDPDSFEEGLSGLTQVLIESSGAECEPIEITLSALELNEVISKYQSNLIQPLTHPERLPLTIKHKTDLSTQFNDSFNMNKSFHHNPSSSSSSLSTNAFVYSLEPKLQQKSLLLDKTNIMLDSYCIENNIKPFNVYVDDDEEEEDDDEVGDDYGTTSAAAAVAASPMYNNNNNFKDFTDQEEEEEEGLVYYNNWIDEEYRIGPDFSLTGKELDLLFPNFGITRRYEEEIEEEEERRKLEEEALLALKRSKKKKNMNEAVAMKVQSKLRAAVINNDPRAFFRKYDKDKGGSLDATEFKKCIRQALKIPPTQLSDRDIEAFAKDLDDDGSGDLDIDELADFVERGMATFGETSPDEELRNVTLRWGERDDLKKKKQRKEALKKIKEKQRLKKLKDIEDLRLKKQHSLKEKYDITNALAQSCCFSLASCKLKHNKIKSLRKFRVYKNENLKNFKFKKFKQPEHEIELQSGMILSNKSPGPTKSTMSSGHSSHPNSKQRTRGVEEEKGLKSNHHHTTIETNHLNEQKLEISLLHSRLCQQSAMTMTRFEKMKMDRKQAVCSALLSSLFLDENGMVTVGGVGFAKTRNAVVAMFESGDDLGVKPASDSDERKDSPYFIPKLKPGNDSSLASSSEVKHRARWWQDAKQKRSAQRTHNNEIFREARQIGGRICTLSVFECWGDFLMEAYDPEEKFTLSLHSKLTEIVTCLSDFPEALSAYLLAVRLNEFPREVVLSVVDRFDVCLPAEHGRWWRRPLEHEQPMTLLLKSYRDRFRGPIWRDDRRRITGMSVLVRTFLSCREDMLIEISPGNAGPVSSRYNGVKLELILTALNQHRILTRLNRLDLLQSGQLANLIDFFVNRLYIIDEDVYYGRKKHNENDINTTESMNKQNNHDHLDDGSSTLHSSTTSKTNKEKKNELENYETIPNELKNFSRWAVMTKSPVVKDLKPFFVPPVQVQHQMKNYESSSFYNDDVYSSSSISSSSSSIKSKQKKTGNKSECLDGTTSSLDDSTLAEEEEELMNSFPDSTMILILLEEVDMITQCHTLYEGIWQPMGTLMKSLFKKQNHFLNEKEINDNVIKKKNLNQRNKRKALSRLNISGTLCPTIQSINNEKEEEIDRKKTYEESIINYDINAYNEENKIVLKHVDETRNLETFSLRVSAMSQGRLLISLAMEPYYNKATRLEKDERERMFMEEELTKYHILKIKQYSNQRNLLLIEQEKENEKKEIMELRIKKFRIKENEKKLKLLSRQRKRNAISKRWIEEANTCMNLLLDALKWKCNKISNQQKDEKDQLPLSNGPVFDLGLSKNMILKVEEVLDDDEFSLGDDSGNIQNSSNGEGGGGGEGDEKEKEEGDDDVDNEDDDEDQKWYYHGNPFLQEEQEEQVLLLPFATVTDHGSISEKKSQTENDRAKSDVMEHPLLFKRCIKRTHNVSFTSREIASEKKVDSYSLSSALILEKYGTGKEAMKKFPFKDGSFMMGQNRFRKSIPTLFSNITSASPNSVTTCANKTFLSTSSSSSSISKQILQNSSCAGSSGVKKQVIESMLPPLPWEGKEIVLLNKIRRIEIIDNDNEEEVEVENDDKEKTIVDEDEHCSDNIEGNLEGIENSKTDENDDKDDFEVRLLSQRSSSLTKSFRGGKKSSPKFGSKKSSSGVFKSSSSMMDNSSNNEEASSPASTGVAGENIEAIVADDENSEIAKSISPEGNEVINEDDNNTAEHSLSSSIEEQSGQKISSKKEKITEYRYCMIKVSLIGLQLKLEVYDPSTTQTYRFNTYCSFSKALALFMPEYMNETFLLQNEMYYNNIYYEAINSTRQSSSSQIDSSNKEKSIQELDNDNVDDENIVAKGEVNGNGGGVDDTGNHTYRTMPSNGSVVSNFHQNNNPVDPASKSQQEVAHYHLQGLEMVAFILSDECLEDACEELCSRSGVVVHNPKPNRPIKVSIEDELGSNDITGAAAAAAAEEGNDDASPIKKKKRKRKRRKKKKNSGGGLASAAAESQAGWANRNVKKNFIARLIPAHVDEPTIEVEIGLATWTNDLRLALGLNKPEFNDIKLRKLNAVDSGATLVCADIEPPVVSASTPLFSATTTTETKLQRNNSVISANHPEMNENSEQAQDEDGDEDKEEEEDIPVFNRRATLWGNGMVVGEVFGPAVWVMSLSARGCVEAAAEFDKNDHLYRLHHQNQENERINRLKWRDDRLKERRREYASFLMNRYRRLGCFLVRSCATSGNMHQGMILHANTVTRHRGLAGKRAPGLGTAYVYKANHFNHLHVSDLHEETGEQKLEETKKKDLNDDIVIEKFEELSCSGVGFTDLAHAKNLGISLSKTKSKRNQLVISSTDFNETNELKQMRESDEVIQVEKLLKSIQHQIDLLPEPLRLLSMNTFIKYENGLITDEDEDEDSENDKDQQKGTTSKTTFPNLASSTIDYHDTPFCFIQYLHSLRLSAESCPMSERADPFALTSVSPEEDDIPPLMPGRPRPKLESDVNWLMDLPVIASVRPWHWWLSLLSIHASECQLAPGSCPVPCCGRARLSIGWPNIDLSTYDVNGIMIDPTLEEQEQEEHHHIKRRNFSKEIEITSIEEINAKKLLILEVELEKCYRERLAEENKHRLCGHLRKAAFEKQNSQALCLTDLDVHNAQVEAKKVADDEAAEARAGAVAKRRRRRLFRRVAQAICRTLKNASMAAALRQSATRCAYYQIRQDLDQAVQKLSLKNEDAPIHGAIGLPIPGDLSYIEDQKPVVRLEADMHQLPRLLGFDGLVPLADLPPNKLTTASENACSTFELEARFDTQNDDENENVKLDNTNTFKNSLRSVDEDIVLEGNHNQPSSQQGENNINDVENEDDDAFDDESSFDKMSLSTEAKEIAEIKQGLGLSVDASGAVILAELVLQHLRLRHLNRIPPPSTIPSYLNQNDDEGESEDSSSGDESDDDTGSGNGTKTDTTHHHHRHHHHHHHHHDKEYDSDEEWANTKLSPQLLKLARAGLYSSSTASKAFSAVSGVSKARLKLKSSSALSPLSTSSPSRGFSGHEMMSNFVSNSKNKGIRDRDDNDVLSNNNKKKKNEKKILVLNLDLSYATQTSWISNKLLLMSIYQPFLSDGLDLVAHRPISCESFHLQLDPEALEELLPPILKAHTSINSLNLSPIKSSSLSFRNNSSSPPGSPISSSSSSSSPKHNSKLNRSNSMSSIPSLKSNKSMRAMSGLSIRLDEDDEDEDASNNNPISKSGIVKKKISSTPGANPTSLAFVGSRPSLAKHLLKFGFELFELKPIPGVIGHGQLCLKNDPGGDRARIAKLEFEKKKLLLLQMIENEKINKEINLRLLCRQYQLDRHRMLLLTTRRNNLYEYNPELQNKEIANMSEEDAGSLLARRYLSCPWSDVKALEGAFKDMDNDNSGALDANEFQDLMFALGIELSDEDAQREVSAIDLDGNGVVDFFEFALWWLTNFERLGVESEKLDGTNMATRMKLKLAMEQRRMRRRVTTSMTGNAGDSKLKTVDAATEAANARAEGDTRQFSIHTARINRRTLTRMPRKSAAPANKAELL